MKRHVYARDGHHGFPLNNRIVVGDENRRKPRQLNLHLLQQENSISESCRMRLCLSLNSQLL